MPAASGRFGAGGRLLTQEFRGATAFNRDISGWSVTNVNDMASMFRGAAAFDAGCRWIYARLAAGEMMVHPRCVRHIEGFQSWDYTRDHPHKDVLDAQRYALKTAIFTSTASTTARLLMR